MFSGRTFILTNRTSPLVELCPQRGTIYWINVNIVCFLHLETDRSGVQLKISECVTVGDRHRTEEKDKIRQLYFRHSIQYVKNKVVNADHEHTNYIQRTSRVPVDGKSSVCAISMKCRNITLIIIIISLG